MDRKKILIVGRSFYPQNSPRSFRITELAKEFSRQGHDVTVLVPKIDLHHQFEKEYNITIKDLGKDNALEFDLTKGNRTSILIKRLIKRSLDLFFYYPHIQWMFKVKKALKYENGYDLLITIAAPHSIHWGAALVRKKDYPIAKTWVADCGDPFMGETLDTFKKLFYFKYLEKYWNKQCDYISVPFKGSIKGYYKEFHSNIRVIPQGFNFDDVQKNIPDYTPNNVPTFAYAGTFLPRARDPKLFVNYLLNKHLDFRFIVYTRSRGMIDSLAESAQGKIIVKDYIPRKKLIQELAKMDFILNLNNGVPTQLPSKLIDYYLTKRPVLSLDANRLNTKLIDEFINANYQGQYRYDNPDQYRIENVSKQFLELISN